MSRRRGQSGDDSLELLLDTVCNVFGGILLMAILVVIQTQATAQRMPAATEADHERALESRRASFETGRLEQQIADLSRQKSILEETISANASPDAQKLLDARKKFVEAIADGEKKLDEVRKELEQADKLLASAARSAADIKGQEDRLREEADLCKNKLMKLLSALPKKVRLPHRKRATGRPIYFVVKGDRAFAFDGIDYDRGRYVSGHCDVVPLQRGLSPGAEVRPRQGAGYPLPKNGRGGDAFLAFLRTKSSRTHYLVLFVYDDTESFASFQEIKSAALQRGYLYVVGAKSPKDECFILSPGTHETE